MKTEITKYERLITVEEVAEFFSCHQDTIMEWIKKGLLQAIKINRTYRITQEELTSFVQRNTMKTGS
jgi:excisionase family DNA binding protein